MHDSIFFYTKGDEYVFNTIYNPPPESTVENWYRYVEEGSGRRYNKADVTGPGGVAKGDPFYEWKGVKRYWRYSKEKMQQLDEKGLLVYSKSGRTRSDIWTRVKECRCKVGGTTSKCFAVSREAASD